MDQEQHHGLHMGSAGDQKIMSMLCEGPNATWQKSDWEFDSHALLAKPAALAPQQRFDVPSCTAPGAAQMQPAMHYAMSSTGFRAGSEQKLVHHHEAQLAPQPGDVILLAHESLPASHKQSMWGQCHVPGCSKSLSGLRDFHQRFQVCDDHIKAPRVVRNNRIERFCQQCSRFHAVHEFEGDRRSCRTQLERHNARRRKQRAAAAARSSAAAAAPAAADGGADERPARRQRVDTPAAPDGAAVEAAAGPESPLDHSGRATALDGMDLMGAIASAIAPSTGALSAGNSDTSWPPPSSALPTNGAVHMPTGPDHDPPRQLSCCGAVLDGSLFAGSMPHGDTAAQSDVMQRTASASNHLAQHAQHASMSSLAGYITAGELGPEAGLQGGFCDVQPNSSAPPQMGWNAAAHPSTSAGPHPSSKPLVEVDAGGTALIQQIFAQPRVARALRRVLLPPSLLRGAHAAEETPAWAAEALQVARSDQAAAVLNAASMHLSAGTLPDGARSTLRISAKLWGCTPDTLPANMQDAILSWVQAAAPEVHGCIRPGCVFLTLDVGLRLDEHRAATAAGALSLLDHLTKWCSCWREHRVALQVDNSLAISVPGQPPMAMHPDKTPLSGMMPTAPSVWPRVLLTDGETPLRLTVRGTHLTRATSDGTGASAPAAGPESVREAVWMRAAAVVGATANSSDAAATAAAANDAIGAVTCDCDLAAQLRDPQPQSVSIIARCRCDDHLMLRTTRVPGASPDDTMQVEVRPPRLQGGAGEVIWIEVWSGTYLSPAIPVLVTPDVELACSVEKLMARFQSFRSASKQVSQEHHQAWEASLMLSLCSITARSA